MNLDTKQIELIIACVIIPIILYMMFKPNVDRALEKLIYKLTYYKNRLVRMIGGSSY